MTKTRRISQIQFLLKRVDEQTIERAWSRLRNDNPELVDDQVADKVEGHFGIANYLAVNLS
jgi:hypothetical protein